MRILTMDGGGSLSLFTLYLLQRIENERPGFLANAEMFSGTSSGGINALLMAAAEPDEREQALRDSIYLWKEVPVFETSFGKLIQGLGGCRALISNANLAQFLTEKLGKTKLGELNAKVAITAFDNNGVLKNPRFKQGEHTGLRSWKPKIFHNFGPQDGSDEKPEPDTQLEAVEVALSTSAAPVFFPIHNGFSDGGLFANNPATCALVQALAAKPYGGGAAIDEVDMLAVGTGWNQRYLDVDNNSWGYSQWLLNPCKPLTLVEAVFHGTTMAVDFQCGTLLGDSFFRLNPPVPKSFDFQDQFKDVSDSGFEEQVHALQTAANVANASANIAPKAGLLQTLGTGDASSELWLKAVITWLDKTGWTQPPKSQSPKKRRAKNASPPGKTGSDKTTAKRKPRTPKES